MEQMRKNKFSKAVLRIDAAAEVEKICRRMRVLLSKMLKRRGVVVGLSGGIDSSVTAGLAARALGPEKVLALLMPETDSDDETLRLSKIVADHFNVPRIEEDISHILEAVNFRKRYNDAVRMIIPEYREGWQSKIVTPDVNEKKGFNIFSLVARSPDGATTKKRLKLKAYLEIVAATNFKQRIRKMLEYYHADRLNFAVLGTPNRLEYDQGFFVKLGDGAADIKPISHLYKTQVYQLAEYFEIPDEVIKRKPTTDTYSLAQGQDEFFFLLPYDKMDLCLFGKNNDISAEIVAAAVGLSSQQVQTVYDDIDTKRTTARYQHLAPLLTEDVPQIA